MPPERAYPRRRQHARPQRQHHAQQRRLLPARERLQHEQARGPRALQALEQALGELGRPETLAPEVEWRRQRVGKLLGTIFGVMCPTLGGGRTADEWPRLRRWDTHLPGQLLGALPTQKGGRQWPHRGQDLLALLWPQVEDHSPATYSRGPWTWVGDDRGVKTDGQQWGVVGTWSSGPEHRVRRGMDGLRLVVGIGEGKRVMPVDCTGRRPDPVGPGGPCRDQLRGWHVRLDRPWTTLQRLRLPRPAPRVVADSWCGDSKGLTHVALAPHGTMLVEGTCPDVFQLGDGRRVTGRELLTRSEWPGRDRPQVPRMRSVRLTATSPPSGPVTVVLVAEPGPARDSWLCLATPLTAPRWIRAWKRRSGIEHHCRRLKHLWAMEACQVQRADASYGHLVLRLLAGLVLLSTARLLGKGRVTREAIVFSRKPHGRFLNAKDLE